MNTKFVGDRNLRFLLHEVFNVAALSEFSVYRQHSPKMVDRVLDAALVLAKDLLRPAMEAMDRQPPDLVNGRVTVHPAVRRVMREMGEGGWIAATFPMDLDGEQLPLTVAAACRFVFAAANYSASVYPELTAGAAHLIATFGDAALIETFVPKMLAGRWQGTMALTEPEAGSSLTDICTLAEAAGDGRYRLQGRKIFISAGDHDGVENVVHLMLAKIEGGPPGVKGISLFAVPRWVPGSDASPVLNGIVVSQIYHKLGYRGAPATELVIGENAVCTGYLVGAPHQGLRYMFQMMNEARLGVGIGAAAIASAAYQAALAYARERCQGRPLTARDPAAPQIPIIEHADVKRMLLFQRAVVEGSLALLLQCHYYADLAAVSSGEDRDRYRLLLDVLTPVAKSYPSEMGIASVSQSLQCFGGYGYCDDFPVEQYYRDARIHPIHEGTTGIQALDLLGRKVIMNNGEPFSLFMDEVRQAIAAAETHAELAPYGQQLADAAGELKRVTGHLAGVAIESGTDVFLADATVYLELFGITAIAWQWLLQAVAAQRQLARKPTKKDRNFYMGKQFVCRYFFRYELPKTLGLIRRLTDNDPLTVAMQPDYFDN